MAALEVRTGWIQGGFGTCQGIGHGGLKKGQHRHDWEVLAEEGPVACSGRTLVCCALNLSAVDALWLELWEGQLPKRRL